MIQTMEERFWSKVNKTDSSCWLWTASKDKNGYGCFEALGEARAHRVSFILAGKTIPDGLYVLHSCDNPSCVNPKHLFLGTAKDNFHDAMNKGHMIFVRGEACGSSKLTISQVQKIRLLRNSGLTYKKIGELVGTTRDNVGAIVRNQSWGWLE